MVRKSTVIDDIPSISDDELLIAWTSSLPDEHRDILTKSDLLELQVLLRRDAASPGDVVTRRLAATQGSAPASARPRRVRVAKRD